MHTHKIPCSRQWSWYANACLLTSQEDPELQNDPLSKLDLASFVGEQLRGLYQREESFFNHCCSKLGPAQLAAVKQCFQQ